MVAPVLALFSLFTRFIMAMRLADFYPVREDSMRYMRYMETKFQKITLWSGEFRSGRIGFQSPLQFTARYPTFKPPKGATDDQMPPMPE